MAQHLTKPQAAMLKKLDAGRPPTEGLVGNARWVGMGQTLRTLRQLGLLQPSADILTPEGVEALEAHTAVERLPELLKP